MFLARKELAGLRDALETLSRRMDSLESDHKQALLDYDEMYEKIRRLYGRLSKREQRATQEGEPPDNGEAPCPDPVTARVMAFRQARGDVSGQ